VNPNLMGSAAAAPVEAPQLHMPASPVEFEPPDRAGRVHRQWLRLVLAATAIWILTRTAYAVLTFVGITLAPDRGGHGGALLQAWDQYDTHWYLLISRLGYSQTAASAFFPLYPTVVGQLASLLGDGQGPVWPAFDPLRLIIALGVANVFSLAGFVGLALLGAQESRDEATGIEAVWALAAYPFAFFLAAAYSEGPFVATAAFALYFARRGSWLPAVAAGLLAGLVRPTAVALVLPLAWEYGRQHDWGRQIPREPWAERMRTLAVGVAVVGAVPLAVASYAAFLWYRFGSPLIWFHVQSEIWHRQTTAPWRTALSLGHRLLSYPLWSRDRVLLLLAVVPLALFLVVLVVSWRRMPFAFALYTLTVCYLAVSAPIYGSPELIESTGRLLLAAIPLFWILGVWLRKWPGMGRLWLAGGFLVQGALLTNFFQGHWIA
jgi:hypothetical protein